MTKVLPNIYFTGFSNQCPEIEAKNGVRKDNLKQDRRHNPLLRLTLPQTMPEPSRKNGVSIDNLKQHRRHIAHYCSYPLT